MGKAFRFPRNSIFRFPQKISGTENGRNICTGKYTERKIEVKFAEWNGKLYFISAKNLRKVWSRRLFPFFETKIVQLADTPYFGTFWKLSMTNTRHRLQRN